MNQLIQKIIKNETFFSIILLFLVTLVTYAPRINALGYYHDDWYLLWSGLSRGAESIVSLFTTDRPYMGVIYSYIFRILGDEIINWHLYALFLRFLGALAFFWILRLLWPNQKYLITLMTILFLVYPGFLSLPNANTKQNHLFGFASALFSIALMLQSLKIQKILWKTVFVALSAILTANYLFIYEYMIGFEGMRIVLLGYSYYNTGTRSWRDLLIAMIKTWWPYAFVTAIFLYWRIFLFESVRNATNFLRLAGDYLGNLRQMSIRLTLETVKDFFDTSIFAWFVMPHRMISSAEYSVLGKSILIAIAVLLIVILYSIVFEKWWGHKYHTEKTDISLSKDFLWIGALSIFFAIFPVVASGREVELTDAYKSYGLHPISGVVIFVVGIILMFRVRVRQIALLALMFISVTAQGLNADRWERFWQYERETWWQLAWRAPNIEDETLVMVYLPNGYQLQQDYEIWGPINLIYRPGFAESPGIHAEVLTSQTAYSVMRSETRFNMMRDIPMNRDYGNFLLINKPSANACAHIIDGTLPVYSENAALLVQQVGSFSNVNHILFAEESPVPPVSIFGLEPPHGWCYYYQKASLARQFGDWEEIGLLYDRVVAQNLRPGDQAEWFPFFEGLVNLGRVEEAKKMVSQEFIGRIQLRYPLCRSLSTNPNYPEEFDYKYEEIRKIMCDS